MKYIVALVLSLIAPAATSFAQDTSELIDGKSNLYLTEFENYRHRFSIWVAGQARRGERAGLTRFYFSAEDLKEIGKIPLNYFEPLTGAFAEPGSKSSSARELPKEVIGWDEAIHKLVKKTYHKVDEVKIVYEGKSRRYSLVEFIPKPNFPIQRPELTFVARGTFFVSQEGEVSLSKYSEGLYNRDFEFNDFVLRSPNRIRLDNTQEISILRELQELASNKQAQMFKRFELQACNSILNPKNN